MGFVCGVFLLLTLPALARTEVVNDFKVCKDFFLEEKAPTVLPDQNRYKRICQKYGETVKTSQYHFATLYDTEKKIPVYSAYKYDNNIPCDSCDRKDGAWYIEPQLEGNSKVKDMTLQSKTSVKKTSLKQALNNDYEKSSFDRGHLLPFAHAQEKCTKEASFTLTNAVPQDPCLNRIWWLHMENKVLRYLKECKEAYVVTGAVPSKIIEIGNKVNVPEYLWTAFCCNHANKWESMAHWAPNEPSGKINELALTDLEIKLTRDYGVSNFLIFSKNCQNPFQGISTGSKRRCVSTGK